MSYEGQTRADASRLKRWVQRRRLSDALRLARLAGLPTHIVDYGAGDGALSLTLAEAFPAAQIICFEPVPAMRAEAVHLTAGHARVAIVADEAEIQSGADLVICTEVFEHLPPAEFQRALTEIERIAAPSGLVIFGVPVETGPPALAKGIFRMARRYGEEDAQPRRVLAAAFGRAPERPARQITGGRNYFHAHLGFDHRAFERAIRARFDVQKRRFSPWNLGSWTASELYLVATPR